jgi:hypothetical protein
MGFTGGACALLATGGGCVITCFGLVRTFVATLARFGGRVDRNKFWSFGASVDWMMRCVTDVLIVICLIVMMTVALPLGVS